MNNFVIPAAWENLPTAPCEAHDPAFLDILKGHGFGHLKPPVPLLGRYTRGRRWSEQEFEACFDAWRSGRSLTMIAAALNRNPQDMIYKLLARCKQEGIEFSQTGSSEGSRNWTPAVAACAASLFEKGMPAWRIATLFRVDFEHVEKELFGKRHDYGHKKKNPFAICTDHKQVVNRKVLAASDLPVLSVLEPFAGEGRFTQIVEKYCNQARIVAVESDEATFRRASEKVWGPRTEWVFSDNLLVLPSLAETRRTFDLIDLDPFVSCREQLEYTWPLLSPQALLFVTLGGEYRRSFIGTNRKSIASRYGFRGTGLSNQEYLEVVPSFFLGWIAQRAAAYGITFDVLRAVRYPNNCRFWLRTRRSSEHDAAEWLRQHSIEADGGARWNQLQLPRFREVRFELDQETQGNLFS